MVSLASIKIQVQMSNTRIEYANTGPTILPYGTIRRMGRATGGATPISTYILLKKRHDFKDYLVSRAKWEIAYPPGTLITTAMTYVTLVAVRPHTNGDRGSSSSALVLTAGRENTLDEAQICARPTRTRSRTAYVTQARLSLSRIR
ncbi:MAG: hypothetical protein GTO63_01725 [Anaerolineae bacterium]|nr:hypothetical protein [Anaerolineae bacterium]NIN93774.1 hypothetical protein [Anaerolineae bacterium]NIQ76809.1 hypothetical protein [Anaerolineae bacterium]